MASTDTSSHAKEAFTTPVSAPVHAVPEATKEPEVNKIFRLAMKLEASDVHLKVGCPPMMRIRGDITRMEMRPLTQQDMEKLLLPLLEPKKRKILDDEGGVDYSYVIGADECRFRVSLSGREAGFLWWHEESTTLFLVLNLWDYPQLLRSYVNLVRDWLLLLG